MLHAPARVTGKHGFTTVLLVEDKSTVLNDSFYLSIIAWSVDVQNPVASHSSSD